MQPPKNRLRTVPSRQTSPRAYRIAKATAPVTVDGKADDWPELLATDSKLVEIQESPQKRYGRVQLRYEADNLYVAWRVITPRAGMKNAGQDYRLLFKTGDVVDVMVGPSEQKPNGVGNSRIVLSVMDGKPVAVLNQPKVPGAPKSESFEFASPWRSFVFDLVVLIPEVHVVTGGKIPGGGYLVEASSPWKTFGINKPTSGFKFLGDVGVLFGDKAGTQTIARPTDAKISKCNPRKTVVIQPLTHPRGYRHERAA